MFLSTILTAMIVLLSVGKAEASLVVNYVGNSGTGNVNMGTVARGQSGTINNIYGSATRTDLYGHTISSPTLSGVVSGLLPSMSEITFSYKLTQLTLGDLQAYGSYSYTGNGNHGHGLYAGSSSADSNLSKTTNLGYFNGNPSLMFVWSTAHLNLSAHGNSTGTVTILNNSNGVVSFESLFAGIFKNATAANNGNGLGVIHYNVSVIPLPAALPLFAALIAAMFGFSHLVRRTQNAAAIL